MCFFYKSDKFSSSKILEWSKDAVSHLLKAFHFESVELDLDGLKN